MDNYFFDDGHLSWYADIYFGEWKIFQTPYRTAIVLPWHMANMPRVLNVTHKHSAPSSSFVMDG
jgi:hypothetical protein